MDNEDFVIKRNGSKEAVSFDKILNRSKTLGNYEKTYQKCEKENRIYARRGIVANQDIKKNSIIKEDMISIKRPALGIPPKDIKKIFNKMTKRKIKSDEPINWKDLM